MLMHFACPFRSTLDKDSSAKSVSELTSRADELVHHTRVLTAWPGLPPDIRATIVFMIL